MRKCFFYRITTPDGIYYISCMNYDIYFLLYMYSCTICHKTLLFLEQGSHKLNEASISLISEKYVHVKYILRLINLIQLTLLAII